MEDVDKMCLNQLFRPKESFGLKKNGYGNCTICVSNEQNKNCKGYIPATIIQFAVNVNQEESWYEFYEV